MRSDGRRHPREAGSSLGTVTVHHTSGAGLRERLALRVLSTATELTEQRQAMFDRIAEGRPGPGRDRALGDLAVGSWTESALLWLGWRLFPGDTLSARLSATA